MGEQQKAEAKAGKVSKYCTWSTKRASLVSYSLSSLSLFSTLAEKKVRGLQVWGHPCWTDELRQLTRAAQRLAWSRGPFEKEPRKEIMGGTMRSKKERRKKEKKKAWPPCRCPLGFRGVIFRCPRTYVPFLPPTMMAASEMKSLDGPDTGWVAAQRNQAVEQALLPRI